VNFEDQLVDAAFFLSRRNTTLALRRSEEEWSICFQKAWK
jgi:hypothetical protein